jgi:hypothetical protein
MMTLRLFRTSLLIPALLMPMLLTAACGTHREGTANTTKSYGNDGYLGITNTNPNLQSSPSTYHTYQVDTDMMRDAVMPIAGVRKIRITTYGTNATVTLTTPGGSTAEEKERIRAESIQALQTAVPRYNFKVKIN